MRPKLFDDMIVTMDTPEHARLWMAELGVSLPTLQLALNRVGNRLNDVREELGMARLYIFPRDDRVMQRFLSNGLIQKQ
jgi:hypothetical protein